MNLFSSDSTINSIATLHCPITLGVIMRLARHGRRRSQGVFCMPTTKVTTAQCHEAFSLHVSESAIDSIRNRKRAIRKDSSKDVHLLIRQVHHYFVRHLSARGIRLDHEHCSFDR
jgi:hypothetical protein